VVDDNAVVAATDPLTSTWYDVAVDTAPHETVAEESPAITCTLLGLVGADRAVACGVAVTTPESADAPPAFRAATAYVYVVPFVTAISVHDVAMIEPTRTPLR
jgi:hypothetical protein